LPPSALGKVSASRSDAGQPETANRRGESGDSGERDRKRTPQQHPSTSARRAKAAIAAWPHRQPRALAQLQRDAGKPGSGSASRRPPPIPGATIARV
jgi:hypothetical protein